MAETWAPRPVVAVPTLAAVYMLPFWVCQRLAVESSANTSKRSA
jgi:hypothetical protein